MDTHLCLCSFTLSLLPISAGEENGLCARMPLSCVVNFFLLPFLSIQIFFFFFCPCTDPPTQRRDMPEILWHTLKIPHCFPLWSFCLSFSCLWKSHNGNLYIAVYSILRHKLTHKYKNTVTQSENEVVATLNCAYANRIIVKKCMLVLHCHFTRLLPRQCISSGVKLYHRAFCTALPNCRVRMCIYLYRDFFLFNPQPQSKC